MRRLPKAALARVDVTKVRDYLLRAEHPQNGGKADYFGAFGFAARDWPLLHRALAEHPIRNDLVSNEPSPYGTTFVVRCNLRSPDGRDPCVTTVLIMVGDDAPRLVTAYP